MKYCITIFCITMLLGCSDTVELESTVTNECFEPAQRERLAKFIVDCSKAANPMSDEEGEDLVQQCERTGNRVICPPHKFCRMVIDGGFPSQTWKRTSWQKDCKAVAEMVGKEKGYRNK